jgi:hypothetical protein
MDERRDLGEGGLAYVRQRLEGGKTFAKLLLEGLDLTRGSVWAYLPPEMPETQAQSFDEWNMPPSTTSSPPARDWTLTPVEEMVWRFLSEQEGAVGVWEDAVADRTGLYVQNHPDEPLFFVGNEVYSVVNQKNLTREIFYDAMGSMSMVAWWGAPAVLATPPAEALAPLLERRPSLTPAHLAPLVAALQMLFFLAYDGLEYICWTPNSLTGQR